MCHCVKRFSVGATVASGGRREQQQPRYSDSPLTSLQIVFRFCPQNPLVHIRILCVSLQRAATVKTRRVKDKKMKLEDSKQWLIQFWRQEFFFFFPVPVIFSVWSPCVPLEDWCVYKRKFHPVMRVSACVHCVCIVFTFRTHFDCRSASKEQKKKGSDFLSFVRKPTVSFHQYYRSQVCPLTNNKPLAKSMFQLCK